MMNKATVVKTNHTTEEELEFLNKIKKEMEMLKEWIPPYIDERIKELRDSLAGDNI